MNDQEAADLERVNEAALDAERVLELLLHSDEEDALDYLRNLLRLATWAAILGERITSAHRQLTT